MSSLFFRYCLEKFVLQLDSVKKQGLLPVLLFFFLPISLWGHPKLVDNIFSSEETLSIQATFSEDSLKIEQLKLEAERFKKQKKWKKFIKCHMEVTSIYLRLNNPLAQNHIDSAIIYDDIFIENTSEYLTALYVQKAEYYEEKDNKKALNYYNKLEVILNLISKKNLEYRVLYDKQLALYQQLNDEEGIIKTCLKIIDFCKQFDSQNEKVIADSYYFLGQSEVALGNSQNALLAFHNFIVGTIDLFNEGNIYNTPLLSNIPDTTISIQLLNALNYKAFLLFKEYENEQNTTALKASYDYHLLLIRLMDQFRFKLGDLDMNALLDFYQNNKSIYENAIKVCLELRGSTGNKEYYEKAYEIIQRSKSFELKTSLQNLERNQGASNLVASIANIQQALHKDALLIDYLFTKKTLYIATISKDTFFLKYIDIAVELQNDSIDIFLGLLTTPSDEIIHPFAKKAHQLYQLLVKPSITAIDTTIQTLLINPDGVLHFIPFEALISKESQAKKYQKLPYLVKKYAIKYIYASSLIAKQDISPPSLKEVLSEVVFFAPFTTLSKDGTIPEEGTFRNIMHLLQEDLEGGRKEIEVIKKISKGVYFVGKEASKENFKKYAPQCKLLHISTHGASDDSLLNKSYLVFNDSALVSSLNRGDSNYYKKEAFKKNNLLYGHEINQLSLKADLVVLSACESGLGKNIQGEGIFSPGRSFMYAGCPNVVMTLWPVSDYFSGQLMELFYQNISQHLSYEKALQQAKIQFLEPAAQRNIFAHPFYWAGFIKIGLH